MVSRRNNARQVSSPLRIRACTRVRSRGMIPPEHENPPENISARWFLLPDFSSCPDSYGEPRNFVSSVSRTRSSFLTSERRCVRGSNEDSHLAETKKKKKTPSAKNNTLDLRASSENYAVIPADGWGARSTQRTSFNHAAFILRGCRSLH